MSDQNQVVVEIKSTYDPAGTTAADRAQRQLSETTRQVTRETESNARQTQRARQALEGMSSAASASRGSFSGLTRVVQTFSGSLAELATKLTLVAGAFTAGYGLGSQIDKWLGLSSAISKAIVPMQSATSIAGQLYATLGKLQETDLAKLNAQFDAFNANLQTTISSIDKVASQTATLADAETQAQVAEIEASMPPGPARDRAILNKKRDREMASISARRRGEYEKLQASQLRYDQAERAVGSAQEDFDTADFAFRLVADNRDVPLKERTEARVRRDSAAEVLKQSQVRFESVKEDQSNLTDAAQFQFKRLNLEDRTGRARYAAGLNQVSAEQAQIEAKNREETAGYLSGLRGGGRSNLQAQQAALESHGAQLESGLPAARVRDLRAQAAGLSAATDSAVAALLKAIQENTAKLNNVTDQLRNLPR
jgi:hypothetical protein